MPPMFGPMAEVRYTRLVTLLHLMESDSVCRPAFSIFARSTARHVRLLSSHVYRQLTALCMHLLPKAYSPSFPRRERPLRVSPTWPWFGLLGFNNIKPCRPAGSVAVSDFKVDYILACRQPAAARPSCLETRGGHSQKPGDNSDITVPQPQDLWRRSWKDLLLHSERLSLHDVALRADVGVELEWQDNVTSCSNAAV